MKKELTIKRALARISNVEAILFNLEREIDNKGIIGDNSTVITNRYVGAHLRDAITNIGRAESVIKDWIEHKMLK